MKRGIGLASPHFASLAGEGFVRVDVPNWRLGFQLTGALVFSFVLGEFGLWLTAGSWLDFGPLSGRTLAGSSAFDLFWLGLIALIWLAATGFLSRAMLGRESLWVAPGQLVRTVRVWLIARFQRYDRGALESLRFVPVYSQKSVADGLGSELLKALLPPTLTTSGHPHINFWDGRRFIRVGAGLSKLEAQAILKTLNDLGDMETDAETGS